MTSKSTNRFLERHAVRIIDTNKRAQRWTKTRVDYFNYKEDLDLMTSLQASRYETEPLFTIEIAESELERIAEFEDRVFNNLSERGHYNLFEHIMEQKEEEKYLRENYPAVKKAYEQYSLMLNLAKSGNS